MTDETKTDAGQMAISQFLAELDSDAKIKHVVKLMIFTLPFKPDPGFAEYYSPDKEQIPILGVEDREGNLSAFFLTKELINSLAVSCVNIQTTPVHTVEKAIKGPKLIVPENGKG